MDVTALDGGDRGFDASVASGLDRMARTVASSQHIPGLVYGVVQDGRLVHAACIGTIQAGTNQPPTVDTPFRIASMTKSFTAAAVLLLRDQGLLQLDDPVALHVPQLAGLRGPTIDSPAITLRHLLTMASGLPTDDPWADRLLDVSDDELDALFVRGGHFARPTGVGFQYSNYGYAMLGRVVANVSGVSCQRFISDRLLTPLGMESTGWDVPAGPVLRAQGHVWRDETWESEPPLADGGFAPMGGLWSTATDLARWVGFFIDGFPPRDDPDDGPLRRSSRREQQQVHRAFPSTLMYPDTSGRARLHAGGYGMGLQVHHDLYWGHHVDHSGGLPGFGSCMRWVPDDGFGLVALGNLTYAPMRAMTLQMLSRLADSSSPLRGRRGVKPAGEVVGSTSDSSSPLRGRRGVKPAGEVVGSTSDSSSPLRGRRGVKPAGEVVGSTSDFSSPLRGRRGVKPAGEVVGSTSDSSSLEVERLGALLIDLLTAWRAGNEAADRVAQVFTFNVDLDRSLARRRNEIVEALDLIGPYVWSEVATLSGAAGKVTATGNQGSVTFTMNLNAEVPPRIDAFDVDARLASPSELNQLVTRLRSADRDTLAEVTKTDTGNIDETAARFDALQRRIGTWDVIESWSRASNPRSGTYRIVGQYGEAWLIVTPSIDEQHLAKIQISIRPLRAQNS